MLEIVVSATLVPAECTYENNAYVTYLSVYETPTGMPRIFVDPPSTTVFVGRTLTITVMVENVQDLIAWQVCLCFDPNVLIFSSAWIPAANVFAGRAYQEGGPVLGNESCGPTILYSRSFVGKQTPFSGSGILCRINFTVAAEGESSLTFLKPGEPYIFSTLMMNSEFNGIACDYGDGEVTAKAYPGDVNRDGKVDIQDLGRATSAFGSYPGHLKWNPKADQDQNDRIDIKDIAVVSKNFGAHP